MDRRERSGDQLGGILAALDGLQATIWTALPGIIQSFDPATQTCTVLPTIQARVQNPDGSFEWVEIPILTECPVFFPGGGGLTLTFPLQVGDECLIVFSSRCIDAWWQSGGVQVQAELRMHDLSDGMVFPGFNSVPRVPGGISTTKAQIRNTSGTVKIEVDPSGKLVLEAINGIEINGALIINGEAYADHQHTGVQPGANLTGGVA